MNRLDCLGRNGKIVTTQIVRCRKTSLHIEKVETHTDLKVLYDLKLNSSVY